MRLRIAVLASALTAFVVIAAPGTVSAAPHHNRGLTINATPRSIIAGEAVLIYGQLNKTPVGGQTIVLYHHINGSHSGYTQIGTTTTGSTGFYEFTRAEGIVVSNRSWFVREGGIHGVHSRTVYEHVAALISITASTSAADTNHPVLFTGHVYPNHAGDRVFLQEQAGLTGDDWKTLKSGRLGPESNYSIPYRFRVPGSYDLRVSFRGDRRNTAAASDSVSVIVQQTEKPGFTINTSAPIIKEGSSATISGILDVAATTTGEPSVNVTLLDRQDPFIASHKYQPIDHAITGMGGSYSFKVTPVHNTEYLVETTFTPPKHRFTAVLFEGVRDVVSISASSPTSTVGKSVTFTGTVDPDKAGHGIELQRLGTDGDYHTVASGFVNASSAYKFVWTFGTEGTKTFRVHVPGGPENVGGVSPAVAITVSLPALTLLAPAS